MSSADGLRQRPAAVRGADQELNTARESVPQSAKSNLTQRLRESSKKAHGLSNTLVAARLAVVCTTARLYARALASFWFVHAAIDAALAKHADLPEIAPVAALLQRVGRRQEFEQDLRFWLGQDWRIVVGRPSPAVQAYLDHFDRMCDGLQPRGAALLAHAYTQQTAMLFGGQRVSGMVRKYIGIQDDEPGTSAFEFKEPVNELKKEYMGVIDSLAPVLGEEGIQQMIAERERVFHMNNDIIRSFKLPRGAYVRTVFKLLPPEVSLLLIFVVLAVLSVWGSNRFMQWAASTKYFGQHMNPEERAQLQNL